MTRLQKTVRSPITLYFGPKHGRAGVDVTYRRTKRILSVGGWYDGCAGIEGEDITLGDFLHQFGITAEDCDKALALAELDREAKRK